MAATSSFDITSPIDFQEVDNALNQARKEVLQRYDFKDTGTVIDWDKKEKISIESKDDFKVPASEPAAGGTVRRVIAIQEGIPIEAAREIVKFIKDRKLKRVQAAIQGDQVRVSSPSKDDLQEAMRALKEKDFGVALHFGNYR